MSKTAPENDKNDNSTPAHQPHYLMWFRRDLRLHDNTALAAICERANEHTQDENASVTAVFFLTPEQWQTHDTSLVQVDHITRTLPILAKELQTQLNIKLCVQVCSNYADCVTAVSELCAANHISCVMANHEYEGNESDRDEQLTEQLAKDNIEFIRWHDQCILPPKSITTNDGDSMYKVFTPFYKKWRHTLEISTIQTHEAPAIHSSNNSNNQTELKMPDTIAMTATTVEDIKKLCDDTVSDYKTALQQDKSLQHIDMDAQLEHAQTAYSAGEHEACQRLAAFISDDIDNYDISRDVPSLEATSQLSAYLTIGAISPRLCYLQAREAQEKLHGNDGDNDDINRWISELAWRDFYRHVLVDKPSLIRHKAYKEDTDSKIRWSYDRDDFHTWCTGMTGVPLVDAAMRCLNATGFMHNRLRMVTAMFLTKDLLIDWRLGERYFMQQLIDGDFASNNGGWQWSASTGTDAAPYFRIMNPFSQAETHDVDGEFIKSWLPELKEVPSNTLHSEEKMRKALAKGGAFSGINYPLPMVDHKEARKLAIAEFKN